MARQSLFFYLLLAASFIAAGVSLLTTALGLQRYLPVLLAWPLAIAVQLGLFGLAWLISVGSRQLRPLAVILYLLAMPFSVVFSYVMLQGEFTAEIRPLESRRSLVDDLRERALMVSSELGESLAASRELSLRLGSYLDLERDHGWTSATCDGSSNPYLSRVCDRVQAKIAAWEISQGRSYRQGPGQQLIFGLLETEVARSKEVTSILAVAAKDWPPDEIFAENIDNRTRLLRFDAALAALPMRELQEVRSDPVELPPSPLYELHARDVSASEERPLYAFEDLIAVFDASRDPARSRYATLFALGLAIFVDLFVLLVALGAAIMEESSLEKRAYPVFEAIPPEWGASLERDITAWIEGSIPGRSDQAQRAGFLDRVIEEFRFDGDGRVILVPRNVRQSRFGHLMISADAATAVPYGDGSGQAFQLEKWTFPALSRYLQIGEPREQSPVVCTSFSEPSPGGSVSDGIGAGTSRDSDRVHSRGEAGPSIPVSLPAT